MKTIIELIFIGIMAACVWSSFKRGLVMTIGSIIVIIISMFIGDLLSDTFAHEAVPMIEPFVSGYMQGSEGSITESLTEVMGMDAGVGSLSVDDAVAQQPDKALDFCKLSYTKMGIYESTAEVMAQRAVDNAQQNSVSMSDSIVAVMCDSVTYYVGFLLFFTICIVLLTVLGNLTNLSFRVPYIGKFDSVIGAAVGVVVGIMFCLLAGWALKFTGLLIPEDGLGAFARLFVNANTYSSFLSI